MSVSIEDKLRRIGDCRELFLKYAGGSHELIEAEMRELGHTDFHRRILYRRFERGRCRTGWIERFGWERLLAGRSADTLVRNAGSSGVTAISSSQVDQSPGSSASLRRTLADRSVRAPSGVTAISSSQVDQSPGSSASLRRTLADKSVRSPDTNIFSQDFDEFQEWLKAVSPTMTWDWKHQVHLYKRLRRVTAGLCKRLMVFMPPRHGKSELVTVRYTAWRMKQDPSLNVIIGSYNQRLANRFSRKIRGVLADDHALEHGISDTLVRNAGSFGVTATGSSQADQSPGSSASLGRTLADRSVRAPSGVTATSSSQVDQSPDSSASLGRTLADRSVRAPSSSDSPFPFTSQRPANSVAEWETTAGGGLRAVGVGSGVTGFGANIIIIDDPVKSRAEAESQVYRDNLWNWFNDDIYTRLEPDGSIVLIQTRWHEDDLAGRLLRQAAEEDGEQWEVVNLPALAEEQETRRHGDGETGRQWDRETPRHRDAARNAVSPSPSLTVSPSPVSPSPVSPSTDPLGRSPGEALCPERYSQAALFRLRKPFGSFSFASLYQQHPVPAEGGMFKKAWFRNIIPAAPPGLRWKRGYDPGVSGKSTADYTASFRIAFDREHNMYIDGGFRKQIEYPELKRYIVGRILAERDTDHVVELSGNGDAVCQDINKDRRRLLGRSLRGIKVTGPKPSRALGWQALAEAGRVYLVKGHWNQEFIAEAASFPTGAHDDQIDAVSIAFQLARRHGHGFHVFD